MKALLVEDQQLLCNLLNHLLTEDLHFSEVEEAYDGESALERVQRERFELVLLDLNLPKVSGLTILRQIKQRAPETCVAVLSGELKGGTAKSIADAGADGLFTKDYPLDQLRDSLRQVIRGSVFICPEVSRMIREFNDPTAGGESGSLSQRELDVLQLVAEGYSSKEVAGRLKISVRTVDAHRRNIMKKCNLRGATEMVRLAVRMHLV